MVNWCNRYGRLRLCFVRVGLYTVLWWAISEGNPNSWSVGAFSVAGAAACSLGLAPNAVLRWRPMDGLRFLSLFLRHTLLGACDVAKRALRPSLRLSPALRTYELCVPDGTGRVLLMDTVSLLPGTLSARVVDNTLVVHALDANLWDPRLLRQFESLINRLVAHPTDSRPTSLAGGPA